MMVPGLFDAAPCEPASERWDWIMPGLSGLDAVFPLPNWFTPAGMTCEDGYQSGSPR